jgi:hypothetical protein
MIDVRAAGLGVQEVVLQVVRESQGALVEAVQAWADAVQSVTPSFPRLNLPYAGRLPKPDDLVNGVFDFAELLLATQRTFAEDLLRVTAPLAGQGPDQA